MIEFNKKYFVQAAKEWNESVTEYNKKTKYNYIIMVEDDPILWEKSKSPIIYGSVGDALADIEQWKTIRNVSIITEEEFIYHYCKKEMDEALAAEDTDEVMLTYFMTPFNAHNKELMLKINRLWKKGKAKFENILVALYKRDFEEIYNSDAFAFLPTNKEFALNRLVIEWEDNAYNYLMHIADDGDLEVIIDFIRDKEINNL